MSDEPDQADGPAREDHSDGGTHGEVDPPAPEHERLMWVLAWAMGIIGAIILIIWAGMLLFVN